jgi:hypothetical protein
MAFLRTGWFCVTAPSFSLKKHGMHIFINEGKTRKNTSLGSKVLIFTEGTIIKNKNIIHIFDYNTYVPIGSSVNKINAWYNQGYNIMYLTSRKNIKEVNFIKNILEQFNFPGNCLYYRGKNEKYSNIVEEIAPNIFIEDDCNSIGGEKQMSITYVNKEVKERIKSIIVKEFSGIDNLPNDIKEYG